MANEISSTPHFEAGQPLSAASLNQIVSMVIQRIMGGGGIEVRAGGKDLVVVSTQQRSRPVALVTRFLVDSVGEDVLNCYALDVDDETVGDLVQVMKFQDGKRSTFDGLTIDGIAYTYTDTQTRHAVEVAHPGNNVDQELIPPYVEGVTIVYVIKATNGYGANLDDDGETPVVGVDMNIDGRAWSLVVS